MGEDEWDLQDGGRCAGYAWGQSREEVHVYVTVPAGTAPANVHVRVTPNTLLVALKGERVELTPYLVELRATAQGVPYVARTSG